MFFCVVALYNGGMDSFILQGIESYRVVGYLVIFFGMFFEGEMLLFAAFYIARQGYLDIGDTYIIATCGAIIGDILWYYVGPLANTDRFRLTRYFRRVAAPVDGIIAREPFIALVISKFTYGFHRITILRTRPAGIPIYSFLRMDVPALFVWTATIAVFGYAFAESLVFFKEYIKFAEVGLLIAILIFVGIAHIISMRSKEIIRHMEKEVK